jgi:FMN-dependent NADH-azoreductase
LNLLHLDCSVRREASTTRAVTRLYADLWRETNPGGSYVYRDFAEEPVPHVDEGTVSAEFVPEADRTEEQRAGAAVSAPYIAELLAADVVLVGVPMYNFSIPSTLKAWLDRVTLNKYIVPPGATAGPLTGKQVVLALARGGSYRAGAPREAFDHQLPYLRSAFGQIGLDGDLTFLVCEMTHAFTVPALAQFKPIAEASRSDAERAVRSLLGVEEADPRTTTAPSTAN